MMAPSQETPRGQLPSIGRSSLMGVIWGAAGLAVLFTVFRYYIRLTTFRRLYLDDALVGIALVILLASAVIYQVMADTMYGVLTIGAGHAIPGPYFLKDVTYYLKLQFTITILFWSCLWAVKFAFMAFFYKLGQGLKRQQMLWTVVLAFTVLAYVGCVISYPIACSSFVAGDCDSQTHVQRALISLRYSTVIDILSDTMVMLLPINLLWKVKINRRQKIALGGIFSLGVIIIVFAIIRVCVTNSTSHHPEPTWLALWSATESSIAVIVSCLASFKTLFSRNGDAGYGHGRYDFPNKRQAPMVALGELGHNSTVVRCGSPEGKRCSDSMSDEDIFARHGVHVKTDFEDQDTL